MANEQQKGSGNPVILRERYLIYPASPLPDFSTPSAQAFIAEDKRDPKRQYFALVVRPGFPPRTDCMRALKGNDCAGLMTLVEWGVVDWPAAERKVMAVVYEKPLGGRVMASLTSEFRRIEEVDIVKKFINPMAEALKRMKSLNVTHRAIRPTNMYWATPERDRIVLGDCTTSPPAYDQPSYLEPLESAMSHPAGRGKGSYLDDSYAIGASLLILMLGRNPAAKMDEEALIRLKVLQGSYSALVGDARLPVQLIEVLRGLLFDDHNQRWHTDGLGLWLAGRRLNPLMTKQEKRASRGFPFGGKEYGNSRDLAIAMSRDFEAAQKVILDGQLELWLRRSLDNADKATAISNVMHNAVALAQDKKPTFDVMVAKVCMTLDPYAPIRYKGVSCMPDGLGTMLALAMIEGSDIRLIIECITRELTKAWAETRETYNPENSMHENTYGPVRAYLERSAIGFGAERGLYELNDTMPCLSPLTQDDYVVDIRDLLPALNAAAKKGNSKSWPIDRHVAAFIAARSSFDCDRQIYDLADGNATRAVVALLNMLALLQWRLGQGGMMHLAGWVAGLMGSALSVFHNRETRKQLEKEIPRAAREGNLVEMARLIDNPEARALDQQGFDEARAEWADMAMEIKRIEAGHIGADEDGLRTAQQIASLMSLTIAFITITLLLISRFF